MTTSHDTNVTVAVSLAAPPSPLVNFQIGILLVALATNTLDGDLTRTYTSASDVAADLASGFISSATAAQLTAHFGQTARPKITELKVHAVDLVGGDTYALAPAALRAAGVDFYAVDIAVRTDAEIVAVSLAIESLGEAIFGFQSADAGLLTASLPAGLADLATRERTFGAYHDTATEYLDAGALGAGLAFDPDSKSAPWTMTVGGVAAYATALTAGQRTNALANNINVLGQFGSISNWLDAGVTMTGREIRHIIGMDWLENRLRARTYDAIISLSNEGEPLPVTPSGQNTLGNILENLFIEGVGIGHFVSFSPVVYPTITATDRSLRRVRVEGDALFLIGGRLVAYAINLSVEP